MEKSLEGMRRDPVYYKESNKGFNLFVTGIADKLEEKELERMFEAYGKVEKCQIMIDPHTKESRGFGFVQMSTIEEANAAREGLTGEERYGRILSVERARRDRPRTPTPGKYFGPPKKDSSFKNRPFISSLYGRHSRYNRSHIYNDRRSYERFCQSFHPYYHRRDNRNFHIRNYDHYYIPDRQYPYQKEDQYLHEYYRADR